MTTGAIGHTSKMGLPITEKPHRQQSSTGSSSSTHPAFYITSWIFFSNLTILFNKWLIDTAGFRKLFKYHTVLTFDYRQLTCKSQHIVSCNSPRPQLPHLTATTNRETPDSRNADMLAHDICWNRYSGLGSHHKTPKWPQDCPHDRQKVPARRGSHWLGIQRQPRLQQPAISVSECFIHSDAQGMPHFLVNGSLDSVRLTYLFVC